MTRVLVAVACFRPISISDSEANSGCLGIGGEYAAVKPLAS